MDAGQFTEEPRASRTTWIVAVTVALAGFLVWQFVPTSAALLDPDAQPRSVTARGDLTPQEKQVISLFETCSPSVVFIRSTTVAERTADPRRPFMRLDPTVRQEGRGSGFIWDSAGHIVTNYHVIHSDGPPPDIEVTLSNHETFAAEIVGREVEKDIAVLKIKAPQNVLPPIPLGSSNDLRVGQAVYAIGNPFGLDQTLTHGIISGLDRDMPAKYSEEGRGQHWITGVIQTDAAINPGNSGGALLDSAARLIGMNTAIHSDTGENTGIGFAIPVDTINRIVTDILRYGQARRPGLGVKVTSAGGLNGVIISEVQPSSAAERAGLKSAVYERRGNQIVGIVSADVIVGVNGKKVAKTEDLFLELDRHQAGDKVKLEVQRGNETLNVEVELQYLQAN